VVIRYHAVESYARMREILITSDDPNAPVRTLEVLAHTVWDRCCDHDKDGGCDRPRCEPSCRRCGCDRGCGCDCGCGCGDEPGS